VTMRALRDLLDEWDERAALPDAGGRTREALRLLAAGESAGAGTPAPLWHRFLDTTRRPRFLQSLPCRTDRHRWADAAFEAVRTSRYGLATMLAQRVREHPGRTLFQESPLPGALRWSYEAIARRLERTAAVFLRAQRGRPRVAILCSNGLDGACADLACLVHGIPVTPLNPETDAEALGFVLERLRVNVVVAETEELRAGRACPGSAAAPRLPARSRRSAARLGRGAAGGGAGRPRPGPGAPGARGP
jgi:non-ribosomal peptide synthetase component F